MYASSIGLIFQQQKQHDHNQKPCIQDISRVHVVHISSIPLISAMRARSNITLPSLYLCCSSVAYSYIQPTRL